MKGKGTLKNFILYNYIFIVFVPTILIALYASSSILKYVNKDILNKNTAIARTISKNIEGYLNEPINLLNFLDIHLAKTKSEDLDSTLDNILETYKIFESIEIIDEKGIVIYSYPENKVALGSNRSQENFYKVPSETKQIFFSEPFISIYSKNPTVVIGFPGKVYNIIGYLNLKEISNSSLEFSDIYKDNLDVSIIDINGVYISNKDINKVYQRDVEPIFKEIKNNEKKESSFITKAGNGDRTFISYDIVPLTNWEVIVYEPYSKAIEPISILIKNIMIIIFVLMILITIFLYSRILLIQNTFNNLNKQTDDVAKGTYNKSIYINSFSEFNNFIGNFNKMIGKIVDRDEELKIMAFYDKLTGLPNRSCLINNIEIMIKEAKISNKSFAVLHIDIDDFKKINDTYGHKAGDEVLIQLSQRLSSNINKNISSYRIGGDEFILLMKNINEEEEIIQEISNIRDMFNLPFLYDYKEIHFNISLGVSIYPRDTQNPSELLQYADTAIYVAKLNGKNNYKMFNNKMKEDVIRKLDIERNLRSALSNNEFILHYQPQIDILKGEIKGFEALIRWNSKEIGFISPLEFISITEETNMIIPIGNWIIENSCITILALNLKYGTNYTISINISPVQLKNAEFISDLNKIIKKLQINPSLIELEITENIFIHSFEDILDILNKIKKLGIKISLDDFGTGYSSFSYLRKLPIDLIKIDKAFVDDIANNKLDFKIVESIIYMAHNLNLLVVAEGVEDLSQFKFIEKCKCDLVEATEKL